MSTNALPPATAAFVISVAVLSVLSISARTAFQLFALIPGNTFLGDRYFWNILTGSLIENTVVKLGVQLAVLIFAGSKAEQLNNPLLTRRLVAASLVACVVSGAGVTFFYLMAYMFLPGYMGQTKVLFPDVPIYGTGPLAAAFAVAAAQVLGDTPLLAGQDLLHYSLFPAGVVAISAVSQEAFSASRDLAPTLVAVVVSWAYLRFLHPYAPGAVGDTRDEFEFLALLPVPLRTPLRPLVKLLGAVFLKLPPFSWATGDGLKGLAATAGTGYAPPSSGGFYFPGGATAASAGAIDMTLRGGAGGAVSAAASSNDPVAERRRERALRALDKKLAELRTNMKGGSAGGAGAPGATPALIPMPPTPADGAAAASGGGPASSPAVTV